MRFGAGAHQVKNGRREGGRLIDGFLVERRATSDYSGPLAALADVVSPEPVLGPELLGLARAVADRYAGSLADVLQLAVPPRSARAEGRPSPAPQPPPRAPEPGCWTRYERGPAFLDSLARGGAPRAVWTALPGPHWAEEIARAVAATLASGRGALVVVPDGRAAGRVDAALTEVLGEGRHALLTAEAGPGGSGTRDGSPCGAAPCGPSSAPVPRCSPPCGTSASPSSGTTATAATANCTPPSPTRAKVLLLRAAHDRCAFLLGSTSCTVEAAQLVETGWAQALDRRTRAGPQRAAPLIRTVGDGELARDEAARAARLPSLAWQTVREGLKTGPVLVQVPRGVRAEAVLRALPHARPLPALRRAPEAPEQQELRCGWCGRGAPDWHCVECGSTRLRAQVVGARRTAEELGRAFPAVPVRTSGRDHVLDSVPGRPALVVSTPGAEPVAEGGYAAALLLDGWAMLGRPDLRAGEEALRRWIDAASLVRGQPEGGTVVVVAEPTCGPSRRSSAGTRSGTPGGSWPSAPSWASRRSPGWPPSPGRRRPSRAFWPGPGCPPTPRSSVLVPLPVVRPGGPRRPGDPPPGEQWERALVRVPPGSGAALAASLKQAPGGPARARRRGCRCGSGWTRRTSADGGTPRDTRTAARPFRGAGGRSPVVSWSTVARAGEGRQGRGSSRRAALPEVGCGGIERAAGTEGSVRVVPGSTGWSWSTVTPGWGARRAP
ncbi:primosomal protein N' [Streptomyces tanashiensis]